MMTEPETSNLRLDANSSIKSVIVNSQHLIFSTIKLIICRHTWQSRSGILLLSFSSLILPSLVSPLLPHSLKQVVFSQTAIVAQAQESQQPGSQKTVLKIGVLAKRGTERALAQWEPLAEYLSTNIQGYEFQIVPLNFEEIYQAVENNSIDFCRNRSGSSKIRVYGSSV